MRQDADRVVRHRLAMREGRESRAWFCRPALPAPCATTRARVFLAIAWCWLLLGGPHDNPGHPVHAATAELRDASPDEARPHGRVQPVPGRATASPVSGLDPADVSPWMRFEAERIVTAAARPPPPGAHWEPVTWPDTWRAPERYRQGVLGWYRFPLGKPPAGNERWAVYLWRFSMNAQVWLNGHYLGSGGSFDEPVARNWNRPLLLDVPAAAWQTDGNELLVRLRVYPGFGHLAPPLVGPRAELEPEWQTRTLVQITFAQVACAIALMTAILGFAFWLVLRNEHSYAWFALLCLAFSVYCLNQFIVDLPVPATLWWPITHIAVDWFAVFLLLFVHRLFGVRRPLLERTAMAFATFATLLYAVLDLPLLARWNSVLHAVSFGLQLYCWLWLCTRAWRGLRSGRRDLEAVGFALFLTVLIGTSTADLLLNSTLLPLLWRSLSYSSQLIVPLLFLAIVVHLAFRMSRTLQQTRTANIELEGRVAAARSEIERAYAEREVLQRQHAAAGERERIYRDLHDDLGARLLSLVYQAGDERQAALARDALAQMRTIVTSARLEGASLVECAEEWRLETELRGEAAGYDVRWHVEGDAPLSGNVRFQLERMVRELASNILQHAHGTQMRFTLAANTSMLCLTCEDDGVGIPASTTTDDAAPPAPRTGHGMAGIERRALELGGSAQWSTAEGGGVRCEVRIPVQP